MSKSVTILYFVEFINQLIDYLINCASLNHEAQPSQGTKFGQKLRWGTNNNKNVAYETTDANQPYFLKKKKKKKKDQNVIYCSCD